MKKRKLTPLCWLLLIPGQLLAGKFFVRLGALLDEKLLTSAEATGHGIPFFSAMFLLIAAAVTVVVVIAAVILTIRGFGRAAK